MEFNKKFDRWLEKKSYRTKDLLFLLMLIAAYIASIVIVETMDIRGFFLGLIIAMASIKLAILINKNMNKNTRTGEG